jgi:hypothetical protein
MEMRQLIAHVSSELRAIADACNFQERAQQHGWSVDCWCLTTEDTDLIRSAYRALLTPGVLADALSLLVEDGVDVSHVFVGAGGADEDQLARVTRADMIELAAAATLLAREGVAESTIVMPNVPKRTRAHSAPGIDVLGAIFDTGGNTSSLNPSDRLFVVSVKHSIGDPGSLRYGLAQSLSQDALTLPYVAAQLRVFHGQLQERGIQASKVMLLLRSEEFLNSRHMKLIAVGAINDGDHEEMERQMT